MSIKSFVVVLFLFVMCSIIYIILEQIIKGLYRRSAPHRCPSCVENFKKRMDISLEEYEKNGLQHSGLRGVDIAEVFDLYKEAKLKGDEYIFCRVAMKMLGDKGR